MCIYVHVQIKSVAKLCQNLGCLGGWIHSHPGGIVWRCYILILLLLLFSLSSQQTASRNKSELSRVERKSVCVHAHILLTRNDTGTCTMNDITRFRSRKRGRSSTRTAFSPLPQCFCFLLGESLKSKSCLLNTTKSEFGLFLASEACFVYTTYTRAACWLARSPRPEPCTHTR